MMWLTSSGQRENYLYAKRLIFKIFVVTNHFISKHTFRNMDHKMKAINCKCGQKLHHFISRNPRTLQRCTLPLPFVPFIGSVGMKCCNNVKTIALILTSKLIYYLRVCFDSCFIRLTTNYYVDSLRLFGCYVISALGYHSLPTMHHCWLGCVIQVNMS